MDNDNIEAAVDASLRRSFFSHPDSPDHANSKANSPRQLTDHLQSVAARSVWAHQNRSGPPPRQKSLPENESSRAVFICGWLHDIGKANPYFQRKLDISGAATAESDPPVAEMTYHARVGAFLTYYCLEQVGATSQSKIAGYLAVAKHHGQLPDAADYVVTTAQKDKRARDELIGEQTTNRSKTELRRDGWVWAVTSLLDQRDTVPFQRARQFIGQIIEALTDGRGSFDEFASLVQEGELQKSIRKDASGQGLLQPDPEELPSKLYDRVLGMWATLTLADKSDTQGLDQRLQADHISRQLVSDEIDALGGEEDSTLEENLNTLREKARQEVVNDGVSQLLSSDTSVGEVTLPTGLGKTLTGIEAALRLRDEQMTDHIDARVIYALPYTSIIEQTRELIERDSSGGEPGLGFSPFSQKYTIHHHRADTVTTPTGEEPDDTASRTAIAVAEAWRAGLTLTTFAQLFESLTGPRNTQSMKLPALRNSVVILDEPQSVPYRWWDATARLIRLLTDEFDATVLLMTATQPRLLEDDAHLDAIQLVDSPEDYLTQAQRVTYTLDETVVGYANGADTTIEYRPAANRLVGRTTSTEVDSALAVCNTIASARSLYYSVQNRTSTEETELIELGSILQRLRTESPEAQGDSLVSTFQERVKTKVHQAGTPLVTGFLSSRHTPQDRQAILAVARDLATTKTPFVFITTQLIEAGVDVSFQAVYRDLAPLESIVQAAGRCNRSFEWGQAGGSVTVWRLAPTTDRTGGDANSRSPGDLVYHRGAQTGLLRLAARTLCEKASDDNRLAEAALSQNALDDYFSELHTRNYSEQSITDHIERAQASQLADTQFIDDDSSLDLIIPQSESQLNELVTDDLSQSNAIKKVSSLANLRVSPRIRDSQQSAVEKATEPIGEALDVRVLSELDHYDASTGLSF
jgi:CRISPR-associated endonuclease/helicase Cas3/CRISPR-associated endonuclease Cas3-HD